MKRLKVMRAGLLGSLCALSLSSFSAVAADPTDGKSADVAVQKILCDQRYVARDDVAPADVVSGVDVKGNPVAPADLPPSETGLASRLPDYIEVPISVDLATRLGKDTPKGLEMNGIVGNARLYRTGKVVYNGEDLTANVTALCQGRSVSPGTGAEVISAPAGMDGTAEEKANAEAEAEAEAAPSRLTAPEEENLLVSPDVPIPGGVAPSMTEGPRPPKPSFEIPRKTVNVSR